MSWSYKNLPNLLILLVACFGSAFGQSAQRKYETYQPSSAQQPLPLQIVEVNNLQNDSFLSDMEIHLKNVSDKPIYYIRLGVNLPAVKEYSGGKDFGIFLRYGRPELIDFKEKPTDNDRPLMPGEMYVFKVPETLSSGFESYARNKKVPTSATLTVRFRIDTVSFGDGSGFINGGLPFKLKSVSSRRDIDRFDVSALRDSPALKCSGAERLAFLNIGYKPTVNEKLASLSIGHNLQEDCDFNCYRLKILPPQQNLWVSSSVSIPCLGPLITRFRNTFP